MKLKVINFDSKNVYGSIKQAVFTSALSYGKIYDLLHKQIWRKTPWRIWTCDIPSYSTHMGRPITFISGWDIKSQYTSPYRYDGGVESFGLNQLFMGQDFRSEYQGDPGDGIYHDDCYLQPKSMPLITGDIYAWVYYLLDGENSRYSASTYYAESVDSNGQALIKSAVLQTYTEGNSTYSRVIQTNLDNTTTIISIGENIVGELRFVPTKALGNKKVYVYHYDLSSHGPVIYQGARQSTFPMYYQADAGWVKVYQDGTALEYVPYTEDSESVSFNPHYKILPMMYTDTGDLTMDRVEFVEQWNNYFELIVHENREWWQSIIRPISLIIAAIIIICSWGSLSAVAKVVVAIGYAVYAAGVLTNNTNLMLIGGIMMAGVSIYTAVESATTTTASTTAQLSTMSTEQALASTSFSGTFNGYASAAGMENLLVMPTVESYTSLTLEGLTTGAIPYAELGAQAGMSVADYVSLSGANAFSIDSLMSIGKELYSAYNNTNQLLKKNTTSSSKTSDTSDDSGVRITIKSSDEEDDVMQYIKKVIDIL